VLAGSLPCDVHPIELFSPTHHTLPLAQPPPPSPLNSNKQSDKPATCKLDTYFVYCKGSRELLQQRISSRKNHFMGAQVRDWPLWERQKV
jgi:hypothetical protein